MNSKVFCDKCGHEFHIMLKEQKQIRRQTVSLQNITNEKEYERKLKRIHKLQNRLENETNILKTKYEKFLEQEGN